jgi:short-subunit dehydrogenase
MTGALLPTIKARGGAIMTVASTAAFQPTPFLSTYGATKAFVLHWSLALNEELRGTGVGRSPSARARLRRTSSSAPASRRTSVPSVFGETSEKVVLNSLRALAAGKSMVVSGWKNKLMTAFVTKFPKPLVARLAGDRARALSDEAGQAVK